jgi:hypothetical protein
MAASDAAVKLHSGPFVLSEFKRLPVFVEFPALCCINFVSNSFSFSRE